MTKKLERIKKMMILGEISEAEKRILEEAGFIILDSMQCGANYSVEQMYNEAQSVFVGENLIEYLDLVRIYHNAKASLKSVYRKISEAVSDASKIENCLSAVIL